MATVRLHRIGKKYGGLEVIKDLDLVVEHGEFVTLVGPSGCGKTTTLRMIAGLEEITSGELYIDNYPANQIPPKDRGISMVFQSYALFPHMSVSENIAFGLKIKKYPRSDILEKIDWALSLLNLEGLATRLPKDLSGGQRQRVALARALVVEPQVLLLDEPLSNLDAKLRLKMRAELKRLHKKLGSTVIYVTHDQVEAMSLSDRVAIMHEGRLAQVGAPLAVYNSPHNIFVAGFVGSPSMNFFNGRLVRKDESLVIDLETFQLVLPERYRSKCTGCLGRKVILGIRPEHIYDKRLSKTESYLGNTTDVVIDVVEPLGDRDIVEVKKEKICFTALLEPETNAAPDQPMTVVFDMTKCHIFDMESENNIIHSP
ncbi:MAG: ABC transporter ATP-binding protein [Desulfobacterales bacterium]|nr:ABC transporter ATP-binding protein [Desulfobacterales bacterium]